MSDQDELNEILTDESNVVTNPSNGGNDEDDYYPLSASPGEKQLGNDTTQWSVIRKGTYIPVGETSKKLPPGYYEIDAEHPIGLFFRNIDVKTEDLIKFPDHNSDLVIKEISNFWEKGAEFEEKGIPFKRGILMWGPPGSGKTCTLQILMKDLIERRKGVCIRFGDPDLFIDGIRIFRKHQPDTPVIVIMEDLDSIFERYNESDLLNLLDGVEKIHKIVFLATTNYPEKLGARVVNRPSRFDKRFKIGYPSEESRKLYLKSLFAKPSSGKKITKSAKAKIIDKWVKDSDKFTFAHLKELFVAVIILEDSYEETIKNLKAMRDVKLKPVEEEERKTMGFVSED